MSMDDGITQVMNDALNDAADIGPADISADTSAADGVVSPDAAAGSEAAQADKGPDFHEELGVPRKRGDGRENRVPISRAEAMATNRMNKTLGRIAKKLGIEKSEVTVEDLENELGTRQTRFGEYESRAKTWDALEPIARDRADDYIRMLAKANPEGYGKFLKVLEAGGSVAQAAQAQEQDDPEPQPDVPIDPANPNGPKQWSLEGLQKAREWDRRQAAKLAEKNLGSRLEPFEKERKERQEREAAESRQREIDTQAGQAVDRMLAKAQKWPHFTENSEAILKKLQEDKTGEIDLYDAYHAVVFPKLAADRTTVRGEVIKEMKETPGSTSAGTGSTVKKPVAEQTLEEAMVAAMRAAGIRSA